MVTKKLTRHYITKKYCLYQRIPKFCLLVGIITILCQTILRSTNQESWLAKIIIGQRLKKYWGLC